MKFFSTFLIYLLVSFGAVIMLLPFGWMVATSFKLPSEVNKWPPQWGSENFLSKREIRVRVGAERVGTSWEGIGIREALSMVDLESKENVLTMQVDDDPFYRGELHILIESDGKYALNVSMDHVRKLVEKYGDLDVLKKVKYKSADEFFQEIFLEYAKILDRMNFISNLESKFSSFEKTLNTISRFIDRRVKSEDEKRALRDFVSEIAGELSKVKSRISVYKKGEFKLLSEKEVISLRDILSKLSSVMSHPSIEEKGAKALLRLFDMKVRTPLTEVLKKLNFYLETREVFEKVQKLTIDEREIVARFRKKSQRISSMVRRLKEDRNLLEYQGIIENLLRSGTENLPERFISALDRELAGDLVKMGVDESKALSVVSDVRQIVSSLLTMAIDRKIDVLQISEKSSNVREMIENLRGELGDLASFKVLKGKLRKMESLIGEGIMNALRETLREAKAISRLRKLYNDSLSELELLRAPSIVEGVRVRDGKVIEVVLEDVSPVYMEDEKYRVAVFFSPTEIIANVFQNYVDAWHAAPFGRYYLNTVIVATTTTILEVIIASMAAFAFSILKFPGRDFLFGLFLMTMMVPGEVLLVPNFITISKFGWIDTYYALIVPWIVSVFAIFLIRQHFLTLPTELYDAAKIDGCSSWRYLWTPAVPLSKPVIITGALLKFVGSWNAFLWVLIVTNSEKYRTLPVGLHTFSSEAGTIYNQLMAAATFSILPVIILFLFMQKYFIRGIARTGLK